MKKLPVLTLSPIPVPFDCEVIPAPSGLPALTASVKRGRVKAFLLVDAALTVILYGGSVDGFEFKAPLNRLPAVWRFMNTAPLIAGPYLTRAAGEAGLTLVAC